MESPTTQLSPEALSPVASPGLSPSGSPNRSRASSRASHLTLDLSSISMIQPAKPTNTLLITPHGHLSSPSAEFPRRRNNKWRPCARLFRRTHTPATGGSTPASTGGQEVVFYFATSIATTRLGIKKRGPPNAVVVAEDLAHALAKLNWEPRKSGADDFDNTTAEASNIGRPRSASSVLLFEPEDDSKEDMPAISVDDYTDSGDERSPIEPVMEKANIHTTRPPVELMHDA
ncbi:hypothetical protein BDD12DRAFT_804067 [Trichophaea hybrida]|nr:hypothetical protein BDD12DRAFT_804067 [Trichophaea hybrida]